MQVDKDQHSHLKTKIDQDVVFRNFFELSPLMMGIADVEGDNIRHIADNEASARFFGMPNEKMTGRLASELGVPPEAVKLWLDHYRESEETGQPVNFTYTHFCENKEIHFSVVVYYVGINPEGNSRFSYIVRDITEQVQVEKKKQEELKVSEERFKNIANALPQIIWTASPDGFVDWYNQWYFEYTGLTPDIEWDSEENGPIHPNDLENLKQHWTQSLVTGEPTYIEFRIKRNCDGVYRWHLSRGVPIRDACNKIIKWIGSNTDIHDQKVLVEELENERELREKFVATLSHDLRTPLTAAKMNAQLLIRKPGNLEFSHRAKSKIVDNLDRADSMIRDLLDVNRIKAGERLPLEYGACHLNSLISDIIDDLTTVHGDRFKFIHNEEIEGHWSCNGIRRILENLCNNAVKYGDQLYPITITSHVDGNWVDLRVHNYGNPIPKSDQSKLFEAFRRADSAQQSNQRGWGLGLSLVRGLAEAHGGNVSVESSAQKGTTFCVRLPK